MSDKITFRRDEFIGISTKFMFNGQDLIFGNGNHFQVSIQVQVVEQILFYFRIGGPKMFASPILILDEFFYEQTLQT